MISVIILSVIFVFVIFKLKSSSKYSQFPSGPISFPILGSVFSLGTKPHEKLSQLKNKYGNVVAVDFGTSRGIVLNDLDTIKEALSQKEFQHRPDMESGFVLRGKNLSGIILSSGKANEEQRAFVLKTMKNFGMGKKSIENLLQEELQRLFVTFDNQLEKPVINKGLFHLTAISALWSIMTGEHGKAGDSEFTDMMDNVMKVGNGFNIFTCFLPTLSKLFPNISGWNDLINGAAIYNYVSKTIQAHKKVFKVEKEPKDLVEAYLRKIEGTNDEQSTFFGKIGDENLQGVLADFLGAGSDTVAASLTWYLSIVIYYPELQEKIQSEIDRVIGGNRLPSLGDRAELPYVEAFILEILRYSALIPLGLPHTTSEDVKIEGYVIPKGTIVLPNAYDALHDPKRWDEPETFKPERFLTEDGSAIERSVARNVDVVFGHGKRICPGETLAKDELFLFITGLGQRYNFQRDPEFHYGEKIETRMGVSLIPVPHPLIIKKR